ncbi:MAG: hypothetical protein F6K55_36625 [Moorea sp. SIO4A3]|nr:hypothetical protein [Moorena sp. SIO4A3]
MREPRPVTHHRVKLCHEGKNQGSPLGGALRGGLSQPWRSKIKIRGFPPLTHPTQHPTPYTLHPTPFPVPVVRYGADYPNPRARR